MAAYPTVTSRAGAVFYVLTADQVGDARRVGDHLRVRCPIHGGDNQASLSILADGSERAGFGRCFQCGAQVLVEDLNPDAARRLRAASGASGSATPRPARPRVPNLTAATVSRPAPTASTPAEYQRAERAALLEYAAQLRDWLTHERARAYLDARQIPLDVAQLAGVGYLPPDKQLAGLPAKWRDRLLFPLGSPAGAGAIGRSLHLWRPGIDENVHKEILAERERDKAYTGAWGRRWEKTNPAGWYGYAEIVASDSELLICEGAFDALAIVAALRDAVRVVALAGVAARAEWIPPHVRSVILALDGDTRGREAMRQLTDELRDAGVKVVRCAPPGDELGKDWSERWRLHGYDGLKPLYNALDAL